MDPNPADMTDEELDAILAEGGVATPPEVPAEEVPGEPETPPADPAEEVNPEENAQPAPDKKEEEPSRREVKRINDLLRKYPPQAPKEEPPVEKREVLNIEQDVDADDQLKERLIADRKAVEETAYKRGREEAAAANNSLLFKTRLEIDAPRVETKYPFLDKDNAKFNKDIANDLNTAYLQAVGYDFDTDTVQNTNVRYGDFAEAYIRLAQDIASNLVEDSKKAVVKQAAQTGLRPDGTPAKPKLNLNKLPSQMSDEELDAVIAQAIPSK
jgi:hypothetical protein